MLCPFWPPTVGESENCVPLGGPGRLSQGGPWVLGGPRCSCRAPTDQTSSCRSLPLPMVLLPEVPLGGGGGGGGGGVQHLPDHAVAWTSWPRASSLSVCLQPVAPASLREGGRPGADHQRPLPPPGRLLPLHGFARPRGQVLLRLPWLSVPE